MSQQPRRRRLEVEDIGDIAVVNFVDKKILDEQNIQMIGDDLFRLVDELGRRKILLNFGNVEFLSSAALGKLITLHRKLQAVQRQAGPVQHRQGHPRRVRDHQARQALHHPQGRAGRPCRRSDVRVRGPGPQSATGLAGPADSRTSDSAADAMPDPAAEVTIPSDLAEARRVQEQIEAVAQGRRSPSTTSSPSSWPSKRPWSTPSSTATRWTATSGSASPTASRPSASTIRITDEGPGFDPEDVPDPTAAGEPRTPLRPRPAAHAALHDRGRRTTATGNASSCARSRNGSKSVQRESGVRPPMRAYSVTAGSTMTLTADP